uniref:Cytochrome b n=1 Tax=Glaucocystis nostochinearum TaxID=38271 RepID=E9P6E9_9EUKA|nr:apocytochrome b [Glaucocystis nostochinearum]ADW83133.1 apocytochrome b [Glaucocystis nostochinearum]
MRLIQHPTFSIFKQHLIDYPTPLNLSYLWGFGSLAAICLVIQILTGILLAMHYTPHVDLAFASVEHIMRDVNYGWFLRYVHANGASMFFIVVYIHMFRGLYYGSYTAPRQALWIIGVAIFLLMMATAFMGYVLPWGQMSFWGATVITNLFSAIPLVGDSIVYWLWGGFSVDNATLNRFFSLHYLMPFVIAGLGFLHMIALHQNGSNNPLGILVGVEKISFYPYFYLKDLVGWVGFGLFFSFFIYFFPNMLGHPDNYIEANPMVTPAHIVPEWYFLPFYAILRSIPDKLGGVIAMFSAIIVLFLLPFLHLNNTRSSLFRPVGRKLFWLLLADCLILGWIGGNVVEYPYIQIGQSATFFYFFYFLICIPVLGYLENLFINLNLNHIDG